MVIREKGLSLSFFWAGLVCEERQTFLGCSSFFSTRSAATMEDLTQLQTYLMAADHLFAGGGRKGGAEHQRHSNLTKRNENLHECESGLRSACGAHHSTAPPEGDEQRERRLPHASHPSKANSARKWWACIKRQAAPNHFHLFFSLSLLEFFQSG